MNFPFDDVTSSVVLTRRRALAVFAGTLALSAAAYGEAGRPVRLILPTSAGSGLDAIFRSAQPALARELSAPLLLDNMTGAGGLIGMQALARSAPDGSTLGVNTNNFVISPNFVKATSFDVAKDFTPIAIVGTIPMVLVVNTNKINAANAKEFIEILKSQSKANKLNFGSSGTGTILHLATEIFLNEIEVRINHVPYKGVTQMVTDLVGGQVDFGTCALPVVQPYIKSGALKAIGVCAAQRAAIAPEIQTFVEQGLPNYVLEAWVAIFGPNGMSQTTVKRVHDAVSAAFVDPVVAESVSHQGTIINVSTPEQARTVILQDLAKYSAVVKKLGIGIQ